MFDFSAFSSMGDMGGAQGMGGATNLFGGDGGMPNLSGLASIPNLFGGSSGAEGAAQGGEQAGGSMPGMQNGVISLPGMQGANSNEMSFEATAPKMLNEMSGTLGDKSFSQWQGSAATSPNGAGAPASGSTESEIEHAEVANKLAQARAEDAKMDKYTSKIPYAGTFITLGRQNDRKIGALLSSYYMMTTPSDSPASPDSEPISVFPRARGTSTFLGGV